jgi:hypothetical protein
MQLGAAALLVTAAGVRPPLELMSLAHVRCPSVALLSILQQFTDGGSLSVDFAARGVPLVFSRWRKYLCSTTSFTCATTTSTSKKVGWW